MSKLAHLETTIFSVISQLAATHGAINLGQGFPDFDVPAALVEALIQAMRDGHHQYPPMIGVEPLRDAIAVKIKRCYGVEVDASTEVTVTSGASEAIFDAIQALVHPDDEVIVLDPAYDCYDPAIRLAGGRAVHIPLEPPTFALDWERIERAITAQTRALILNSPHNPTGSVLAADDLQQLARVVERSGIFVISDEVYEHLVFDDQRHETLLRWPVLRQRAFVVSSFGKTYHCTGWKIGYVVAPPGLSSELRKVHQFNTFTSFAPAQYALAHMITHDPAFDQGLAAFYQKKRDLLTTLLVNTPYRSLPVRGGYFQLVDYSAVSQAADQDFVRWLIRLKGVAAIPLSSFYAQPRSEQRLIRLCFAKQEHTLSAAIQRLSA